jgi:hypothetical protein
MVLVRRGGRGIRVESGCVLAVLQWRACVCALGGGASYMPYASSAWVVGVVDSRRCGHARASAPRVGMGPRRTWSYLYTRKKAPLL